MPGITSNIHYKYYIGIGFLILVIIGSYIMLQQKKPIASESLKHETNAPTNLHHYDFDTSISDQSSTQLLSASEKLEKITTLEHRKRLFELDLMRYQQLYDKYNNRIIILNKKKNAANKQQYAELIDKTQKEIALLEKQLYFLKKE